VLEQFSGKQSSPFMETAGKAVLPIYGTVWATASYCLCNCVLLFVQLCLTACATVSYYLCNCVLLFVQLCLTACATASYCLCNCVLLPVQLCLTAYATASYCLCNYVLLFGQLRLTVCTTVSYCLWKWLARSFPIYGNGFRSCTSENQRLHKELSNSKNRVTYRLR